MVSPNEGSTEHTIALQLWREVQEEEEIIKMYDAIDAGATTNLIKDGGSDVTRREVPLSSRRSSARPPFLPKLSESPELKSRKLSGSHSQNSIGQEAGSQKQL